MNFRHGGNYDNSDETADNDEEETNVIQCGQCSIGEDDDGATEPSDEDKCDVNMPWLDDEVWVEYSVHLYGYICRNKNDGSQIKYPSKEIQ